MQFGKAETLDGGHGRQEPLGEHQGLGHDVHQDFVALPDAMKSSTLVLHQRGRGLLTKFGKQVATACLGWYLGTALLAKFGTNLEGLGEI